LTPEWVRAGGLVALAAFAGIVGWCGHVLTLPVAMAFPALWVSSPSRRAATAVSAAYFLAASRGLPQGVAHFYSSDLWPGLVLWVAASLFFVAVHALLWTGKPGWRRTLRYLTIMVLMAMPPFGIVGWAHPITAAGVLFPGWGWWGFGATAFLLLATTGQRWQIAAAVLGGLYVWSVTNWTPPKVPVTWTGVDLAIGQRLGRDTSLPYHQGLIATVRSEAEEGRRFVVLPESALGFWTPTVARLWKDGLRDLGSTVIAGATVLQNQDYDNVLVAVSADEARILYRERMPVPVSMWQPWRTWTGESGGARAQFFANPVVEVAGTKIATLICYEQLIVWPVLQSMLQSSDVIVAVGNGWWTTGTSIVSIQKASAMAWARLFGKPLVMAFNI
jgi:apolipoprotein N-acyltransferase